MLIAKEAIAPGTEVWFVTTLDGPRLSEPATVLPRPQASCRTLSLRRTWGQGGEGQVYEFETDACAALVRLKPEDAIGAGDWIQRDGKLYQVLTAGPKRFTDTAKPGLARLRSRVEIAYGPARCALPQRQHSIAENEARLLSGETQIDGWDVRIEQNERRWYSAKLTGIDHPANHVYAPERSMAIGGPTPHCPPGIKTFCHDLATKIADLNSRRVLRDGPEPPPSKGGLINPDQSNAPEVAVKLDALGRGLPGHAHGAVRRTTLRRKRKGRNGKPGTVWIGEQFEYRWEDSDGKHRRYLRKQLAPKVQAAIDGGATVPQILEKFNLREAKR